MTVYIIGMILTYFVVQGVDLVEYTKYANENRRYKRGVAEKRDELTSSVPVNLFMSVIWPITWVFLFLWGTVALFKWVVLKIADSVSKKED